MIFKYRKMLPVFYQMKKKMFHFFSKDICRQTKIHLNGETGIQIYIIFHIFCIDFSAIT